MSHELIVIGPRNSFLEEESTRAAFGFSRGSPIRPAKQLRSLKHRLHWSIRVLSDERENSRRAESHEILRPTLCDVMLANETS
jgi:hypothetical protein